MSFFSVITLFGGLAFFLFGMESMSNSLEKIAGSRLKTLLKKMTSSPLRGLSLGAGVTMAVQSSSAITVMLVGLVNSGIMDLGQTVSVIMGTNIGTTITAWILSLAGIESDVFIVNFFKPDTLAPISAIIGIVMTMASKSKKHKDIGGVLLGFGLLLYGMKVMSGAVSPLKDVPEFTGLMTAFQNPFLGVLVGLVITGIIQSSSASVGILQAISLTGSVTFGAAIPIIMGQNSGTCVTALLSSIGTSRNAKRVAIIHILFNIIGTLVFMAVLLILNAIFKFAIAHRPIDALGIAICHSIFNVVTTFMLMPFRQQLEKLSKRIIPINAAEQALQKPIVMLDERLLLAPSLAVAECLEATRTMSKLAHQAVLDALGLVLKFDQAVADGILAKEKDLDQFEDKLGSFLVKIAGEDLSLSDSREVSKMLQNIGDFERLGDHALNLCESAEEMRTKDMVFSEQAQDELAVLTAALTEILALAHASYENDDNEKAALVEPLEQVIDTIIAQIKRRHVERLQCGKCTIELGFVLNDILANCERISDHCSNIAVCVEEADRGSFATHEFLNALKTGNDEQYRRHFEAFAGKYALKP